MLKTTKAVRGTTSAVSSRKPGGQRISETNRAVESVRSAFAPCLRLGDKRLIAVDGFALNQKDLLVLPHLHNFVG